MDNHYIFEIKPNEDCVKIPPLTIDTLNKIIHTKMELGKAADIYHLTTEHLRYCGPVAKTALLNLINSILEEIYYLSCPQIKRGLGTAIYKGKNKPRNISSSYRRVTVTPQIGNIIDRYIDPIAEELFRKVQSPEQMGFTKGVSYLMAAMVRGECQRWAIDTKKTCFGVSFDGRAAFPSVDRDIQVRELYAVGERGDLLHYSNNTYQNTECAIKLDGKVSRQVREVKGSRQGHVRASGHFKSYINPCLTTANSTNLGFNIGPICVTNICVADDNYALSEVPRDLQGAIDIIAHYGRRYRVVFGPDKTKVTVTGSKQDMAYYRDIKLWTLNGDTINVTENNDQLGLIVSGVDEEMKNVDKNIQNTRKSLFSLLGPAFAYRCKLSPTVQLHLWRVYCLPILRSGLGALPIRSSHMQSITIFHHKILRGFLKISQSSPTPALYFLLGELPLEANLHMDVFSLFYNIWSNKDTVAFSILKYVLQMGDEKSLTWSIHARSLFKLYNLPDPLLLLSQAPWSKDRWKDHYTCLVRSCHEKNLREMAKNNSKMQWLNVSMTGLSGNSHPILHNIHTTRQVEQARPQIKMLCGDYLNVDRLVKDRKSGDPTCKLCPLNPSDPTPDTLPHLLTKCKATATIRERILPELLTVLADVCPEHPLLHSTLSLHKNDNNLAQFFIDPTSFNLQQGVRPTVHGVLEVTRGMCYAIDKERTRLLKQKN